MENKSIISLSSRIRLTEKKCFFLPHQIYYRYNLFIMALFTLKHFHTSSLYSSANSAKVKNSCFLTKSKEQMVFGISVSSIKNQLQTRQDNKANKKSGSNILSSSPQNALGKINLPKLHPKRPQCIWDGQATHHQTQRKVEHLKWQNHSYTYT